MKKILFASTAFAALALGGAASAEVALFGDARLGLGYNITNSGGVDLEPNSDGTKLQPTDDFRAVSRVRFGVTMTGETDSGITFGATIRADNAQGGQGDPNNGQTAGEVFVSGAWGTLTFGDTNAADEQNVGDASGNLALTGLGDLNETPYISNGGGFGDDDSIQFANNPDARPTVRYDYNFGGFGVSVSTNRSLDDIGVGGSYTYELANGSITGGVGYYDFSGFDTTVSDINDEDNDPTTDQIDISVKGGEQWSVGLTGAFGGFSGGVVYSSASSESSSGYASGGLDVLNIGLGYTFDAWSVSAYYAGIVTAEDALKVYDGRDSYGASVAYDLGGGASVNAGIAQTYGRDFFQGTDGFIAEVDSATVADFGIKMSF